jgi:hypothetical protein
MSNKEIIKLFEELKDSGVEVYVSPEGWMAYDAALLEVESEEFSEENVG